MPTLPEFYDEVPLPAEFRQLLRDWTMWGATERDWSRTTQLAYRRRITSAYRWLRFHKQQDLLEADTADLRDWLASMPPTAASRNMALQALRAFWGFLHETGRRPDGEPDPTTAIKHLRKRRALPKALDSDQQAQVLALAQVAGHRWYALLTLLLYTGMRASEVRTLEWDCIEGDWRWVRWVAKGRKDRVLPLHPVAVDALRAWRTECTDGRWVFPSPRDDLDQPMSDGWMRVRLRAIGDLAGIPKFHAHVCRHTFATELVERGVNITTVADAMGHENVATTSIYLRARPSLLVDAIGKLQ